MGKPPQGNAWLLSKAVPVDVRLLAGGAASLGALYYYSTRFTVGSLLSTVMTLCNHVQ